MLAEGAMIGVTAAMRHCCFEECAAHAYAVQCWSLRQQDCTVPPLGSRHALWRCLKQCIKECTGTALQALAAVSRVTPARPNPLPDPPVDDTTEHARHAPLLPVPEIQGVFLFGYTMYSRLAQPPGWRSNVSNAGVPTMVVNGSADVCAQYTKGSFERLQAPKVAVELRDLGHFSIADTVWRKSPSDDACSLPREAQARAVAASATRWFQFLAADRDEGQPIVSHMAAPQRCAWLHENVADMVVAAYEDLRSPATSRPNATEQAAAA